jgi:hypothetical protein
MARVGREIPVAGIPSGNYREIPSMNRNLVRSIYERFSIKIANFVPIL